MVTPYPFPFHYLMVGILIFCFVVGIYPNWRGNKLVFYGLVSAFTIALIFVVFNRVNVIDLTEPFQVSNEALLNVGSIFNSQMMKVGNLEVSGSLTVNGATNFLPRGIIVAWNGTDVPKGWSLCNGQNGTPDLKNRFILGSGSRQVNDMGGEESHNLSEKELPKHRHHISISMKTKGNDGGCCEHYSTFGNGTSSIVGDTDMSGEGQPHNNMPPFYVLAYIMRTT